MFWIPFAISFANRMNIAKIRILNAATTTTRTTNFQWTTDFFFCSKNQKVNETTKYFAECKKRVQDTLYELKRLKIPTQKPF